MIRRLATRALSVALAVALGVPTAALVWGAIVSVPLVGSWVLDLPAESGAVGLGLGLLAVAVGQAAVLLYHAVRRRLVGTRLAPRAIGRPRPYRMGPAVTRHLWNPEGLATLGVYLVASWRALPASYRGGGPLQWHAVLAQLVVVDALQYGAHRLEHAAPRLYRAAHKPHHAVHDPVLFDAYAGSVLDTLVMVVLPLFLTSQLVRFATVWSYAAFGSLYANQLLLIHSEYEHAWDPVARLVGLGTARDHHQHHRDPRYNLGHLFTWWDRLAGRYRPAVDPPVQLPGSF